MARRQPHLLLSEADAAPYVVLPGDPGRVPRVGQLLEGFRELAWNREFRSGRGTFQGVGVLVTSSGIGGPSTAIAVEELCNLGARVIIRVGSCGALQPNVHTGHLVVPQAVVREDGTSLAYAPASWPAVPDLEVLQELVRAAREQGATFHVGITLSRDRLYSDPAALLQAWEPRGVIASEMEAATLFTVGRLRGARTGAVLAVVSELAQEGDALEGIGRYAGEASSGVAGAAMQGEQRAIRAALHAIAQLARGRDASSTC